MEESVLEKEQHFLELNEELEMKSRETWQEIEKVLKRRDIHSNAELLFKYTGNNSHNTGKYQGREIDLSRKAYESALPMRLDRKLSVGERQEMACSITHKICSWSSPSCETSTDFGKQQGRDISSINALEKIPSSNQVSSNNIPSDSSSAIRSNIREDKSAFDCEEINEFIPPEGKQMSTQSKLRFLTAKTKVLYEECLSLRNTLKKQREESLQLRKSLQKIEDERQQWLQSSKQFEETAKKNAALLEEANRRCMKKDAENTMIRKDMEKINKELKMHLQKHGNSEVRLNRTLEENEKLKSALKSAKLDEKERSTENKKRHEEFISTIQKLEKQKCELIAAFKKQLQLTDNLKRQRILTEVNSSLEATEENFLKLLDWNPEKTEK